jgi:glycosyltransferase involved in cell wall biosynthesis
MNYQEYCILIPAYQAMETLPTLLDSILKIFNGNQIFVIDDGSTDNTKAIARHYSQVRFITHDRNRGKGAALLTGIQIAVRSGFRYAVCLDADLQHDPAYIPEMVAAQRRNQTDLVLGKRDFHLKTMPFHRILSNTITSFLISIRTGRRVHDSQCGYRLMNLKKVAHRRFAEDGFQFESEILIKLLSAKTSFSEIPIPTIYNNARSSISNTRDTFKFIILFFKSYLWT